MTTMTTGRTLDEAGRPIDGTGFDYDSGGRLAELLGQRLSPIYSQPATGEWIFATTRSADTNGEYERGVVIFRSGNAGPSEHIHPGYDESFEVVQGEFVFRIEGREQRAGPGGRLVSRKGSRHTFRNVGNGLGVVIGETRPAARVGAVIATLFGLAHEGQLTPDGRPKLFQGMVIGSEYADDTVFTKPAPAIAIPVAKVLAPIGRRLGYRPTYDRFLEDSWWATRVEQPPPGQDETA
jgi:mannose-6-phosphate isomerase-like protein (cupin superfamily)